MYLLVLSLSAFIVFQILHHASVLRSFSVNLDMFFMFSPLFVTHTHAFVPFPAAGRLQLLRWRHTPATFASPPTQTHIFWLRAVPSELYIDINIYIYIYTQTHGNTFCLLLGVQTPPASYCFVHCFLKDRCRLKERM